MSTYDESLHPRGTAQNAGQFRAKANSAPASCLAEPISALDAERHSLEQALAEAADRERGAWLVYAMERYDDGTGRCVLSFEKESVDGLHAVFADDFVEDESVRGAVPEWMGAGEAEIEYASGKYDMWLQDDDGQSCRYVVEAPNRLGARDARRAAEAATEHRAAVRDTAEQLAIVEAFERLATLSGGSQVTFTPYSGAAGVGLRCTESRITVAAGDSIQAQAFQFPGQGLKQVKVTRSGAQTYLIERSVLTQPTQQAEVLTNEVSLDGHLTRWARRGR